MQLTLEQIFYYASWTLTIIEFVSFIIALIKAIKNKKFNQIKELVIGFIEEAEKLTAKNGGAIAGNIKKEIVLSKVRTICNNLHFKYVESVWSAVIDNYVDLTLKVNQRPSDAVKLEQQTKVTGE